MRRSPFRPFRPPALLAAACIALVPAALAAQARPAAGRIPVMRGADGTEVWLDSAAVYRTGERTFSVKSVVQFPELMRPAEGAPFDREVDVEDMDCAAAKTRSGFSQLFRGDSIVFAMRAEADWEDVPDVRRAVFDATCQALSGPWAASLPPEPDVSAASQQPELLNARAVMAALVREYPRTLRDHGLSATVTLRFRVGTDGVPQPATVDVVGATDYAFADAAVRVVQAMRFRPATVRNERVMTWVTIPIQFEMRGQRAESLPIEDYHQAWKINPGHEGRRP